VNYLNTKPLLYGIEHSPIYKTIELIKDHPANLASLLLEGQIDIGLVPVAILPEMKQYQIITNYCIGCDGPVASVCLFSDVPIEQVEKIILDRNSRTSVELLKILLKYYWKVDTRLSTSSTDEEIIKGKTAVLVIGDRSFERRKTSRYIYDLGEAWKNFTGLPFVFAAWISNKQLPDQFAKDFNDANRFGIENIDKVIVENKIDSFDLKKYFTTFMNYTLDEEKKEGLEKFLDYLKTVA